MRKRLIIIVPKLWLGGQERVAAKTADLLSDVYDVTLIVFDRSEAVYAPSCEVVDLRLPAKDGTLNKLLNALRRASAVRKIREERSADFVYSFGTTANLVNVLSRGTGKTVTGLREYQPAAAESRIARYICSHADLIIGCAEETCAPVRDMGPRHAGKTVCLYNPLDADSIAAQGNAPVDDYRFSPHTVVSHGRLDGVKNWPRLIKAFSIVKQTVPDAQLLIIGEGEQREQLERLIAENGLQEGVTLPGFRENPFAYLAKSALYVLPSYSEGFPNALAEGMVFLPVIAADCKSGPREILSRGAADTVTKGYEIADYGVLVQPASDRAFHEEITEDDAVLATAMLTLLQETGLAQRMKEAAANRAAAFSCGRYRERLIEILEGSCNEH